MQHHTYYNVMFNSVVHSNAVHSNAHITIYYGYVKDPRFARKKSVDYMIYDIVKNTCN